MHMADLPHLDAEAIFPPLTANEGKVLEALTSDSVGELRIETIVERTGLSARRAERALASLASRRPPLVEPSPSNRVARAGRPASYSLASLGWGSMS
jgi:hypothetical protein